MMEAGNWKSYDYHDLFVFYYESKNENNIRMRYKVTFSPTMIKHYNKGILHIIMKSLEFKGIPYTDSDIIDFNSLVVRQQEQLRLITGEVK